MISISLFVHPYRQNNIKNIIETYNSYKIIDEVLIVTGKSVEVSDYPEKFKFVYMPEPYNWGGWPSFGLLSRYTFALSCKNRFVFIQDDDIIFEEVLLENLYNLKEPLAGTAGRWFENELYHDKKFKGTFVAPICLTSGLLIDTSILPEIIKFAKIFWKDYQKVFNGEDIFLSYATAKITGKTEFMIMSEKKTE